MDDRGGEVRPGQLSAAKWLDTTSQQPAVPVSKPYSVEHDDTRQGRDPGGAPTHRHTEASQSVGNSQRASLPQLFLRPLESPASSNGLNAQLVHASRGADDSASLRYGGVHAPMLRAVPAAPMRYNHREAGFSDDRQQGSEHAGEFHPDDHFSPRHRADAAAPPPHSHHRLGLLPVRMHGPGIAPPPRRFAPYPDVHSASAEQPLPLRTHATSLQRPDRVMLRGPEQEWEREQDPGMAHSIGRPGFDPAFRRRASDMRELDDNERQQQQQQQRLLIDLLQQAARNGSLPGFISGADAAALSNLLQSGSASPYDRGGRAAPGQPPRLRPYAPPYDDRIDGERGAHPLGRSLFPPPYGAQGRSGHAYQHYTRPVRTALPAEEPLMTPTSATAEELAASGYADQDGAGNHLGLLAALASNAAEPRGAAAAMRRGAGAGMVTAWEDEAVARGGRPGRHMPYHASGQQGAAAWQGSARSSVPHGFESAPAEEQLAPSLPLTIWHMDRKCPKLLAPRSGRVGDTKHVVLPAEIAQALPQSMLDADEPVLVRAVLLAPYAPNGAAHWHCDISCRIGNGPGGFPALHLPVPEAVYGRPVRRFTLCEDMVLELELGEAAVQPRVLDTPGDAAADESAPVAGVDGSHGAEGHTFLPRGQLQLLPLAQRHGAGAFGEGSRGGAAAAAIGAVLAAADKLRATSLPPVPAEMTVAAAAAATAAGSSSCRSPPGTDAVTADPSEHTPLQLEKAAGCGGDGGGDGLGGVGRDEGGAPEPQEPIVVRRPRDGKPTVMRACTGAVGSKKHLPLPLEILRALTPDERTGAAALAIAAVYRAGDVEPVQAPGEWGASERQAGAGAPQWQVERLVCVAGPSGSHGCSALQIPISERMNGRRLLDMIMYPDHSIELGLGEVVSATATAGSGRKARGRRASATAPSADADEETETDDEMRQAPSRRRSREDTDPAAVGAGVGGGGMRQGFADVKGGYAALVAALAASAALAAAGGGVAAGGLGESAPPLKRRRSSSTDPQTSADANAAAAAAVVAAAAAPEVAGHDVGSNSARGSCDGDKEPKDRGDVGTPALTPEIQAVPRMESVRASNTLLGDQEPAAAVATTAQPYSGSTIKQEFTGGGRFMSAAPATTPPPSPPLAAAPHPPMLHVGAPGPQQAAGGQRPSAGAAEAADPTAEAAATLGRVWSLLQHVPRAQLAAVKALAAARQRRISSPPDFRDAAAGGDSAAVLAEFRGCLGSLLSLLLQAREAASADSARQQAALETGSGGAGVAAAAGGSDPRVSRCLLSAAPLMLHAAECLVEWYDLLLAAAAEGEAAAVATAGELGGSAALVRSQLAEALAPLPPTQPAQTPPSPVLG